MKLQSSMTLFAYAAGQLSVFYEVLEKYFNGRYDEVGKQKSMKRFKMVL